MTDPRITIDVEPQSPPAEPPWRTVVELVRLPLVFTAAADLMMGYLVTHGGLAPVAPFVLLLSSSCCLYWSGMVLNDVFDVEQDRRQRPHRPIPSGRIDLAKAGRLGALLLLAGLASAILAGLVAGDWRPPLIAGLLAACVVAYDRFLKRTPLGPPAMGACRSLNVLLGMSASAAAWHGWNLLIAAGVGVYIAGVTLFARTEAEESRRPRLALGLATMLTGMALLAWLPDWDPTRVFVDVGNWRFLWLLLAVLIGWRCVRAIARPSPPLVQTAVRNSLLSLVVLDAAVVFALCGREWAFLILLLIFPSMLLGRWLYST